MAMAAVRMLSRPNIAANNLEFLSDRLGGSTSLSRTINCQNVCSPDARLLRISTFAQWKQGRTQTIKSTFWSSKERQTLTARCLVTDSLHRTRFGDSRTSKRGKQRPVERLQPRSSSAGMVEPASGGGDGLPPRTMGKITGGGGGGDSGSGDGPEADLPGDEGGANSLWAKYCALIEKYPLITKAITAACLNFVADLFCQLVVEKAPAVDPTRLIGFAAIGLLIVGPSLHIWYGLLPRIITLPGDKGTLLRLAIDQLIFSPLSMVAFFVIVLTLEGKPGLVIPKLQKDLVPTVLNQWKVWIPFQFANFKFVPPSLQVLMASLVGLIWTVYMSLVTHSSDAPPADASIQTAGGPAQSALASS